MKPTKNKFKGQFRHVIGIAGAILLGLGGLTEVDVASLTEAAMILYALVSSWRAPEKK